MVKGRALARPSERSERFEPVVRCLGQRHPMAFHNVIPTPEDAGVVELLLGGKERDLCPLGDCYVHASGIGRKDLTFYISHPDYEV